MIEGFAARATGHLTTMLATLKSTTMGSSREAAFCNGELAAMGKEIGWALRLTEAIVGSLRVVEERPRRPLIEGFATATEIADALVRTRQLSFRQAHNVVGRVVRLLAEGSGARNMTAEALNAAARELLELDLELTEAELAEWLEPMASVEIRATRGGPAPGEVRRMLRERTISLARYRDEVDARQAALQKADTLLRETARRFTESAT
jgi:argininosuccinate lyase